MRPPFFFAQKVYRNACGVVYCKVEDRGCNIMEKIRTTVRVAGKDYTIASYDPEAHVQRVAAFVDRKLNELSAATRLPQAQLSVLAALNIADDMLKAHDEITRLRRELMETQQKLEAAGK